MHRSYLPLLGIVVLGLVAGPRLASGQTSGPPHPVAYVGLSAGPYLEFPEPFADPYCDEAVWAGRVSLGYRLGSGLAIEGSALTAGVWGEVVCAIPGIPAPPPGSTFERTTYADRIRGSSLVATTASLTYDFSLGLSGHARARAGMGRLWDKHLNSWLVGVGYRLPLAGQLMTVDLDRWHMGIPAVRDRVLVGSEGQPLIRSSDAIEVSAAAMQLRIGIEIGIR